MSSHKVIHFRSNVYGACSIRQKSLKKKSSQILLFSSKPSRQFVFQHPQSKILPDHMFLLGSSASLFSCLTRKVACEYTCILVPRRFGGGGISAERTLAGLPPTEISDLLRCQVWSGTCAFSRSHPLFYHIFR